MAAQVAKPSREQLLLALETEVRQQSLRTVLFHQAVAERLGLNATDHKCLDLIVQAGPLTPGRLVELTGLTSGAVTGVLDRLERARFVRREHDLEDRRRILVCPVEGRADRELAPLFDSMRRGFAELCASYTDEQLALLVDFCRRTQDLLSRETLRLREAAAPD